MLGCISMNRIECGVQLMLYLFLLEWTRIHPYWFHNWFFIQKWWEQRYFYQFFNDLINLFLHRFVSQVFHQNWQVSANLKRLQANSIRYFANKDTFCMFERRRICQWCDQIFHTINYFRDTTGFWATNFWCV